MPYEPLPRSVAIRRLFLIGLAILPSLAVAQEPESIDLQFQWPVGLSAEVHLSRLYSQATPAGADSTGLLVSYHLSVREHPAGRLIAMDDFQIVKTAPVVTDIDQMEGLVGTLIPSFFVDASGTVLGVTELDRLRANVQGQIMRTMDLEVTPRGLPSMVERMTQAAELKQVVQNLWAAMIDAWKGASFLEGAVYESVGEEPSRIDPSVVVPTRYRFGVVHRTPCHPGDAREDCVELRLESKPMAAQTEIPTGLGLDLFPDESNVTITEVSAEDVVSVIAEPQGLFPHLVEIKRTTTGQAEQQGDVFPFTRTLLRRIEFVYRSRPRP